jgi:adenosine/AMP kinase
MRLRVFIALPTIQLNVIIMETEQGRAILRVVDGFRARGIEKEENVKERKLFHRNIGFKLRLIRESTCRKSV